MAAPPLNAYPCCWISSDEDEEAIQVVAVAEEVQGGFAFSLGVEPTAAAADVTVTGHDCGAGPPNATKGAPGTQSSRGKRQKSSDCCGDEYCRRSDEQGSGGSVQDDWDGVHGEDDDEGGDADVDLADVDDDVVVAQSAVVGAGAEGYFPPPPPPPPRAPSGAKGDIRVRLTLTVSRTTSGTVPGLALPPDCGACQYCLDKVRFGGQGTVRKKCLAKQVEARLAEHVPTTHTFASVRAISNDEIDVINHYKAQPLPPLLREAGLRGDALPVVWAFRRKRRARVLPPAYVLMYHCEDRVKLDLSTLHESQRAHVNGYRTQGSSRQRFPGLGNGKKRRRTLRDRYLIGEAEGGGIALVTGPTVPAAQPISILPGEHGAAHSCEQVPVLLTSVASSGGLQPHMHAALASQPQLPLSPRPPLSLPPRPPLSLPPRSPLSLPHSPALSSPRLPHGSFATRAVGIFGESDPMGALVLYEDDGAGSFGRRSRRNSRDGDVPVASTSYNGPSDIARLLRLEQRGEVRHPSAQQTGQAGTAGPSTLAPLQERLGALSAGYAQPLAPPTHAHQPHAMPVENQVVDPLPPPSSPPLWRAATDAELEAEIAELFLLELPTALLPLAPLSPAPPPPEPPPPVSSAQPSLPQDMQQTLRTMLTNLRTKLPHQTFRRVECLVDDVQGQRVSLTRKEFLRRFESIVKETR